MKTDYLATYISRIHRALDEMIVKTENQSPIPVADAWRELLALTGATCAAGGRLVFCGNGASAAMASHLALDWMKNGGVPAICFNDAASLTAFANDDGLDEMFAGPLRKLCSAKDLLVAISSSGNSPNVVRTVEAARDCGMKIITFTGRSPDNKVASLGTLNFHIPAQTYGMIECAHQILLHAWLDDSMNIIPE